MSQKLLFFLLTYFISISLSHPQNNDKIVGNASYYHDKFHGRVTASGEIYHKDSLTAAHPQLPFGTFIRVTNMNNKKTVTVKVNDRGPFVKGRVIDVSKAAATRLGMIRKGIVKVSLEVIP